MLLFATSTGCALLGCLAIPAGSDQLGHLTGSICACHAFIMMKRHAPVVGQAPHSSASICALEWGKHPIGGFRRPLEMQERQPA
jgi:hypothetical protein